MDRYNELKKLKGKKVETMGANKKMKSIKVQTTIIIFLILIFLQWPVFADGNRLLRSCEVLLNTMSNSEISGNLFDAGFCLGYVQGVHQLNRACNFLLERKKQPIFCSPHGKITNNQAVRIITKYLKEHPEQLHEEEIFLVIKAFGIAFPCKK